MSNPAPDCELEELLRQAAQQQQDELYDPFASMRQLTEKEGAEHGRNTMD